MGSFSNFNAIVLHFYNRTVLQIGSQGLDSWVGMAVIESDYILPVPDMEEQVIKIISGAAPAGTPLMTVLFLRAVIVRQDGKFVLAAVPDKVLHPADLLLVRRDSFQSDVSDQLSDIL